MQLASPVSAALQEKTVFDTAPFAHEVANRPPPWSRAEHLVKFESSISRSSRVLT
jgi:hypothetical protein